MNRNTSVFDTFIFNCEHSNASNMHMKHSVKKDWNKCLNRGEISSEYINTKTLKTIYRRHACINIFFVKELLYVYFKNEISEFGMYRFIN